MVEFRIWLNNFLAVTGINILKAAVILASGFLLARIATSATRIGLQRTPIERTTTTFVISIINVATYAVVVYFALNALVPNISAGLIAVLGSAALAVGLALKDSLGDFAGGIMIIFNKPFSEGDYIEVDGTEGTIRAIRLLHTVIYTSDNKKVVIGNGRISRSKIVNYSARPTRRVDMEFSCAYGSDVARAKGVLLDLAKSHPAVLSAPEPLVRLYKLGDSALIFRVRAWVNNKDYWTVWYDMQERVYERFGEEGIVIPYASVSVHLARDGEEAASEESRDEKEEG